MGIIGIGVTVSRHLPVEHVHLYQIALGQEARGVVHIRDGPAIVGRYGRHASSRLVVLKRDEAPTESAVRPTLIDARDSVDIRKCYGLHGIDRLFRRADQWQLATR